MRTWILVLGAVFALSTRSVADAIGGGHEGGNGGNAIICRNAQKEIVSVELLDYYEGKLLYEFNLDLGGAGNETDRARFALQRLARLDRVRAERWEKKLESFFPDVRWIDEAILGATNDFGYVPLKKDCVVEPVAVQKKLPFPELKRYMINRDLWSRLPIDHRAGLVLHEIIYGEALGIGHKDSISARYLTGLLSSTKLLSMVQGYYEDLMVRIGFSNGAPAAPTWVVNPIRLGVKVGSVLESSLSTFVHHPTGLPITISAEGSPAWVMVTPDGKLRAEPPPLAAGTELAFIVIASDGMHYAKAQVIIQVPADAGVHWLQDPVSAQAREDVAFRFDLRPLVSNVAGVALGFSATGLPAWLSLSEDGVLFGVPHRSDVGSFTATLLAGQAGTPGPVAIAKLDGVVLKMTHPLVWSANPVVLADAKEGNAYTQSLTSWVFNPEGTPVSFQMLSGPAWMTMSLVGVALGTPSHADVGDASWTVEATTVVEGQKFTASTVVRVRVLPMSLPPTWTQNPIALPSACVNQLYAAPLGQYVNDFGGHALALSKVSGEAWLAAGVSGSLRGTPQASDVGENRFVIRATNSAGLSADVMVVIKVKLCP